MSEAIERLRQARRQRVELRSGRVVELELPRRLAYLSLVRSLPTPIINKAKDASEQEDPNQAGATLIAQASSEERDEIATVLDGLVDITVKAIEIEGEMEPVLPEDHISEVLTDDEYIEVLAYAQRTRPLPKASEWKPSGPSVNLLPDSFTPSVVNGSESIPQDSSMTTSWR